VVASVVEEQIAKLEEVVYSIIETLDTNSPAVKRLLKDLEKKKADLEAKLLSAINDKADESLAHLGQTGIDMLFFDESHKYKNLAYTTKLTDVRGLGNPSGSDRAAQTLIAARQMQKMRNGDKGVVFASGTTITNTVAEVYNLLTYLRPQKMKELGIETFDNFVSTFAETSSKTEITAAGTMKNVQRIRKFRNLPELSILYAEIADVKNDYNFKLPKPQYQGGKPKLIICKADRQQKAFMRLLMDYGKDKIPYEGLGLGPLPGPNSENAKQLIIDKLAEKAAIDMRLLFPDATENPTGKIRTTAHMVAERYFETNHQKGTQAIFCDSGTPKGGRQFSVYDRLREILVSEYGIPKAEVAFIHEFNNNPAQKADLERRLNSGEIRIVIGHSDSLGIGMNFQERGAALYHMDVLYTPDKHTQRDGRYIRQGNVFAEQYNDNEVPVYYIGAEMSLDARKFDLNDTKSRIIHQFKTADINMREVEDMPSGAGEMDFGEWSATIMGSPLMLEKGRRQTLEVELSAEKGVFERGKRQANLEIIELEASIERSNDTLGRLRPDYDKWQKAVRKDADGKIIYQVQVGEKIYESPKEAGIALKAIGEQLLKDGALNSKHRVGLVYDHVISATVIEELLDATGQLKVRRIHWTVNGKSATSYKWGNISTNEGDIEVTLGRFPIEAMNHIETLIGNLEGSISEKTEKIEKLKEKWAGQWEKQQEFEENKLRLAEIEQLLVGEELRIDEEVDEVMGDVDGFDMPASFKPRDPTKIPTEAVSDFEQRRSQGPVDENGKPFKIYEEFINLMRKWAPNSRYGEGKTNRRALGTYFPRGKHIRSRGVNDFAVNMHELAHAIDDHYGIIRNLIPDSYEAQKLIEIYKEFYGAPSNSHSVQRKLAEGYAMLIEMTIKEPTMMNRRFPEIIKAFLTNGGAHAFKDVEAFMGDVENIIIRFHRLPSLEQAGAFIRDDKQVSAVIGPSEHWNEATLLEEQMFDRLARIEELVRRSGKLFTSKDVAQYIRFSNNALNWADQNIAGFREEYWHLNEKGELRKVFSYNYKTIDKGLKKIGKRKEFGWYLYFRRIHFEYQRMREMEEQRNMVEEELHSIAEALEDAKNAPGAMTPKQIEKLQVRQAILQAEAKALTTEIKRLAEILSKERHVSELQAKDAYQRNEGTFVERDEAGNVVRDFEAMHDALTLEDLKFLANPMVQIITPDEYQMYSRRKGYVHFRREKYDELRDPDDVVRTSITVKGQTKLASLKARTGSTRVLLDPFVGSQINHQEIMIQGMRQAAMNKFKDLAADYPQIFKPVQYYPGIEQSPGHIIIRDNYKRKVYYAPEIAPVIEENYSYQPPNFVDAAVLAMGRVFRAGTTSLYWQFVGANIPLDQMAAAVNSRNGIMPFYTTFKMMGKVATQYSYNRIQRIMGRAVNLQNSAEAYYFKEWLMLAGTYQTFAYADRDTLRHTPRYKGKTKLTAAADAVNRVGDIIFDIVSTPGVASEVMTRATEYILARKAGKDQFVAFEEGGRVSGPFHHVGSWKFGGKMSAAHYIRANPYANAGLQVFHQTIRSAYQNEAGAMRLAITVTGLALTAAASMMYFMSLDDDDEQKKILKTIQPELLARYMYLPNPYSDDKLIRIRVPDNLTMFSTLISMMVLEFYDQTTYSPKEWGIASTAWLPQQWQFFEPTQLLMSYFPPIIKAPIEVAFNTRTFPDVRPIEMPYEQYKRPSERYSPYSSEFAKDAAKALEEFGDLDIKLGISPKKIDHLLENGVFGRGIKYVTGKPGAFDFRRVLQQELWLAGARQLKFYYEVKDELDQKMQAHNDGSKRLSDEEYRDISYMRNLMFGTPQRSYRTKKGELRTVRSKNGIDDLLKIYKNIDDEKDKAHAQKITGEIFDRIREVERVYYGKGKPGEKRQKK
jgi:hypothetical protein